MPEPAASPSQTWSAPPPTSPAASRIAASVAGAQALDGPAEKVSTAVRGLLGTGTVKDLLSGTWLGHALHPLLTDVPIGAWTSATILDLAGGADSAPAAERLIGVGIAAALPTAVSGLSDWADSTLGDDEVRRVGAVHAVANVSALALYGASWAARKRGRHGRGVLLGLAGAAGLGVGGFLGGHLSYARGIGVDQTAFDVEATDWTDALGDGELAEGEAKRVSVAEVGVMVTRQQGRVFALAEACSHRGGPLHEGEIADGCVTCPWHGTIFRLADGSVERGPATYPQPAYDVRVREGRIELKSAAA